jgi:multicomponent Na+:H+ antiporter subunit D
MTNNLPVLPVVFPLITAVIVLLFKDTKMKNLLASVSSVLQVAFAVVMMLAVQNHHILITPMSGWAAPFGIMLTVDLLSATMVLLSSIIGVAIVHFSFTEEDSPTHPLRLPLIFFILAGITLSFVTGDLFNLFVAFEIMLISSYALVTLEMPSKSIRHGYPYLAINIIGGALFLISTGLVYALFGSLNFADIAISSSLILTDPRIVVIGALLMVVFGLKAGFFPMYYWLPNTYPKLPPAITALFAALLTKVGIYALLRVFGTMLPHHLWGIYSIILVLAIPTMCLGVFGALSRNSISQILSFNIIAHIGVMMAAIGLFTTESLASLLYYITHHIIVITSLFLAAGLITQKVGSDDLSKIGNLWQKAPFLTTLFFIQSLSLAGIPPLSGFWGKWMLIVESLDLGATVIVAFIILSSVLSLYSVIRITTHGLWTASTQEIVQKPISKDKLAILSALVVLSLVIGVFPNKLIKNARLASQSLISNVDYTTTVMSYQSIREVKK